jgi:hypothetical protein
VAKSVGVCLAAVIFKSPTVGGLFEDTAKC